ncbi:MAG: biotin transporter BioY, partial [Dorea sp.]|nr:biotin transporter BioY [Dorea sp.]
MTKQKGRLSVKDLAFCGVFAALIAVGAFLKVTIPVEPYAMHFTMQWFFVLLAGYFLGGKLAGISVSVYLLIGLAGVPVFASGGGIGYLIRPTFGFLLGFALAAFLIGYLTEWFHLSKVWQLTISGTAGLLVYYGMGMI